MEATPPPIRASKPERDDEHIKLLAIFHYVLAGFITLGMLFLVFHFFAFNAFFENEWLWNETQQEPPPAGFFAIFKWFYAIMGITLVVGCVVNVLSAVFMTRRVNRMFSIVVAGVNCIQVPLGTILGVFTIIVLTKPSVQSIYQDQSPDIPE